MKELKERRAFIQHAKDGKVFRMTRRVYAYNGKTAMVYRLFDGPVQGFIIQGPAKRVGPMQAKASWREFEQNVLFPAYERINGK